MSIKWKVKKLQECESTFTEARKLPAWTVVTSVRQHKGRGRFNRTWFGEEGGLWASFNLPIDPGTSRPWGMMPLVAGVALLDTLAAYHIKGLRLRWPNDLLVNRNKLAGILVERPSQSMVSVGIGINVYNNLVKLQGATTDVPVRLVDLIPNACPSLDDLRDHLADELAKVFTDFIDHGPEPILTRLEQAWGPSLPVVAITDTERICGFFSGIESDGSPILRKADGTQQTIPAISINRLKELI